jgi:hypothetical protein
MQFSSSWPLYHRDVQYLTKPRHVFNASIVSCLFFISFVCFFVWFIKDLVSATDILLNQVRFRDWEDAKCTLGSTILVRRFFFFFFFFFAFSKSMRSAEKMCWTKQNMFHFSLHFSFAVFCPKFSKLRSNWAQKRLLCPSATVGRSHPLLE